ncbi:M23 family metallopeptidase [Alcanivorax sp.]|jgi:murein DD-endopeptidase MepM/ murein hydrolase activator NlpD|uniref:M23 family metallopeptidase n=1 Tax=Alcanivorax sp. TaxID=1872427 RepID=UPI0032D8F751
MKLSELKRRGSDGFGAGHFGAPRGSRTHKGVDLLASSGEAIESPVTGTVTKLGYSYGDDLSYRYVQITAGGYDFRVFYVDPSVRVGQGVTANTAIGLTQDLGQRYPGIPNHVHFEIKKDGDYLDPTPALIAMGE